MFCDSPLKMRLKTLKVILILSFNKHYDIQQFNGAHHNAFWDGTSPQMMQALVELVDWP